MKSCSEKCRREFNRNGEVPAYRIELMVQKMVKSEIREVRTELQELRDASACVQLDLRGLQDALGCVQSDLRGLESKIP